MNRKLGNQPIEPRFHDEMNIMGKSIDEYFNGKKRGFDRNVGFILMVFPFNDHEGRCNYISNAQRDDVILLLREQLKRFEAQDGLTAGEPDHRH